MHKSEFVRRGARVCSVHYWLYSGHTPYRFAERGVPDDELSIVKEREAPYPLLARSPRDRELVEAIMVGIRTDRSSRLAPGGHCWRGRACGRRRGRVARVASWGSRWLGCPDSPAGEEPSDNARDEDAATGIVADGEAGGVFPAQGEDSELWGFARRDGSWWVEPVFSQAPSPFCEGLACTVDPNGRGLGYLDETGAWQSIPSSSPLGASPRASLPPRTRPGSSGTSMRAGIWRSSLRFLTGSHPTRRTMSS